LERQKDLLKLIRSNIKFVEYKGKRPFRHPHDIVSTIEGINEVGDCGPFEVTVVADEYGKVKKIEAVIKNDNATN